MSLVGTSNLRPCYPAKGEETMRKVFESLDEGQRSALLWLADLGIAVFSSAIIVLVLKSVIDWF